MRNHHWIAGGLFLVAGLAVVYADSKDRAGKFLLPFQVVTFPNDVCVGTDSKNGTCYTKEECSNKDGLSSGSCAEGYGVCCVVTLSCGGTSSDNCTYIEQSSATAVASPCTYTICPCSDNVCRIRFSFESFILSGPVTGAATAADATAINLGGDGIGDCMTDQFSISSPGNVGTPVICGTNTGQHMWVDANPKECHSVNFHVGAGVTTSRAWTLKVVQYDCGVEDIAGPQGCLQYHTADTGTIESFNFPTTAALGATTTHLSNQHYDICFRRNPNMCAICFARSIAGANVVADQGSFGLSVGSAAGANGATDTQVDVICDSDYLVIPDAVDTAALALAGGVGMANRICGRELSATQAMAASNAMVCTGRTPFRVNFHTDSGESTFVANMADGNELAGFPAGIIGFKLAYTQTACL